MDVHLPIAGMSVNLLLRLGPGGALGSPSCVPGVGLAAAHLSGGSSMVRLGPSAGAGARGERRRIRRAPILPAVGAGIGDLIFAAGDRDLGTAGGCPS